MKREIVYNNCYGGFGLSQLAIEELKKVGFEHDYCSDKRHDKRLVEVVKRLGHLADGFCASLKIGHINGNVYRISEYDGLETILEPEDVEWITIKDDK